MKQLLISVGLFLFGLYLVFSGFADLVTTWRARSWPTVQGTVISSDITESKGRRGRIDHATSIRYEYKVGGNTFTGDRIAVGDKSVSSIEDATAFLARYPMGIDVTVHYQSKNPVNALLETGTYGKCLLISFVGFLFAAVAAFVGRSAWQDVHANPYAPSRSF